MIEPAASGHHQHQSGQGFHARLFRSLPFDEEFRPNAQEYAMIEPAGSGHHQHQSGVCARVLRSLTFNKEVRRAHASSASAGLGFPLGVSTPALPGSGGSEEDMLE